MFAAMSLMALSRASARSVRWLRWLVGLAFAFGCSSGTMKVHGDASVGEPVPLPQGDSRAPDDPPPSPTEIAIVVTADLLTPPEPGGPDVTASEATPPRDGAADEPTGPGRDAPADGMADRVLEPDAVDAPTVPDTAPGDAPMPIDRAPDIFPDIVVYYSAEVAGLADLCRQTGGEVTMQSCPKSSIELASTCPTTSYPTCMCTHYCDVVALCSCPNGCFLASYGCVGTASAGCTVGQDQTCNDDPTISSIHGHCLTAGYCSCYPNAINPSTGKCL
jgi:hypothetical protein